MTKYVLLTGLGLIVLIAGGTCLPVIDNTARTTTEDPTLLAVAITEPVADDTVPEGEIVTIGWTGSNRTSVAATVTVILESRADLSRVTLVTDTPFNDAADSIPWDTTGYTGPYSIIVRITAGDDTAEATSAGLITVDPAPSFTFLSPTADVDLDPNHPLTIRWIGADNNAGVQIGIDVDQDHTNGDETTIAEPNLPETAEENEFEWDGTDLSGQPVDAATYYLYAIVDDSLNPQLFAEATGRITVPEPEDEGPQSAIILDPNDDVDFLDSDGTLTIKYAVASSQDALVDINIDLDDNHNNGNETTILFREFVEADTDPNDFVWDGKDTASPPQDVPDGIYRIYLAISTGSGSPRNVDADGLVFRRDADDQPLIALIKPATNDEVDVGETVNIEWRDDTAAGEDDEDDTAQVRVVIDDDGDPATTGDQTEILPDVDAAGDGVQDTFAWKVQSSQVTLGNTYYIIAYIKRGADEHAAVAPGTIEINDP